MFFRKTGIFLKKVTYENSGGIRCNICMQEAQPSKSTKYFPSVKLQICNDFCMIPHFRNCSVDIVVEKPVEIVDNSLAAMFVFHKIPKWGSFIWSDSYWKGF